MIVLEKNINANHGGHIHLEKPISGIVVIVVGASCCCLCCSVLTRHKYIVYPLVVTSVTTSLNHCSRRRQTQRMPR